MGTIGHFLMTSWVSSFLIEARVLQLDRFINLHLSYTLSTTFLSLQIKLQTLDIAGNKFIRLENVAHLEELEELWVCLFVDFFY